MFEAQDEGKETKRESETSGGKHDKQLTIDQRYWTKYWIRQLWYHIHPCFCSWSFVFSSQQTLITIYVMKSCYQGFFEETSRWSRRILQIGSHSKKRPSFREKKEEKQRRSREEGKRPARPETEAETVLYLLQSTHPHQFFERASSSQPVLLSPVVSGALRVISKNLGNLRWWGVFQVASL